MQEATAFGSVYCIVRENEDIGSNVQDDGFIVETVSRIVSIKDSYFVDGVKVRIEGRQRLFVVGKVVFSVVLFGLISVGRCILYKITILAGLADALPQIALNHGI